MESLKRFAQFVWHIASLIGSLAGKIVAHILYFQICWVYYTNRGVGLVVFLMAFSFAFFKRRGRRDSHSVLAVCNLLFWNGDNTKASVPI